MRIRPPDPREGSEPSSVAAAPSILFEGFDSPAARQQGASFLEDLHLDEVIDRITAGYEAFDLDGFYREPLVEATAVRYRQDVFRDLEQPALHGAIKTFTESMSRVRNLLGRSGRAHYLYEHEHWFLDAAAVYTETVEQLTADLRALSPASSGLRRMFAFVDGYRNGTDFAGLARDIEQTKRQLAQVEYTLDINAGRVVVSRFAGEPDYGTEISETFARFQQGGGRDYVFRVAWTPEMNHVEAAITDRVAMLFPRAFTRLDDFRRDHDSFTDPTIVRFDREVQFYLAYLEQVGRLRRAGLSFCYPELVEGPGQEEARDTFDLALAFGLVKEGGRIVSNDFELHDGERLIVVSGPNQGGKTTFGRMFGQVHHLVRIGVPVPGTAARLTLADAIYTHFERQEQVEDLAGKLEEDLIRIRTILASASAASVLVMNESFNSTMLSDQLFINTQVVEALVEIGCIGVVVTFLDELASLHPSIVSMVSTVEADEPARRTFRIIRRRADGLAYAMSIAEKHGLTADRIAERLKR